MIRGPIEESDVSDRHEASRRVPDHHHGRKGPDRSISLPSESPIASGLGQFFRSPTRPIVGVRTMRPVVATWAARTSAFSPEYIAMPRRRQPQEQEVPAASVS